MSKSFYVPGKGLYIQDGVPVITHSMLKTFKRCPKQAEFKYAQRLKPRLLGSPLKRGVWIHSLLEAYHMGEDWEKVHRKYIHEFQALFEEEQEMYGDLPSDIHKVITSYIWHYQKDPWIFHEVEKTLEAKLPNGVLYRGKVDAIVETQFGLFLVDHKSHKTLPNLDFRIKDPQSALYLWAAWENGIPVQGFIWNYIKWKPPTVPQLLKDCTRLYRVAVDTDYPTYVKAIKKYKAEYPDKFKITLDYKNKAEYLKRQQYEFGHPQTSSFFRRDILEKSKAQVERVVKENAYVAEVMNSYPFNDSEIVGRIVDRSCSYSCSYADLCAVDLIGGDTARMIRQNYIVGDPNDYYEDRAGDIKDDRE